MSESGTHLICLHCKGRQVEKIAKDTRMKDIMCKNCHSYGGLHRAVDWDRAMKKIDDTYDEIYHRKKDA